MEVISKGLDKEGIQVKGFTDPQAAIDYFKDPKAPCDLVVSDSRMPVITGFELARRIKALRSGVRIVMVSAFEINKEEFDGVLPTAPIDGFLTKPFQISQLVEVLRAID